MIVYFFILHFIKDSLALLIERIPSTNPSPDKRMLPLMQSFPNLNLTLSYGGLQSPINVFNDIWSFQTNNETWSKLVPLDSVYPVGRYGGGSWKDQDSYLFYIFGGMSTYGPINDIWSFHATRLLWTKISATGDIPLPRVNFGYTSWTENGAVKFAVFGGSSSIGFDNHLYILDTDSWVWTMMPSNGSMPPKLESPCITYYSNALYIAGGQAPLEANPYINGSYKYDLDLSAWVNISSLSTYTSRYLHGCVIFNDELYMLSGWSMEWNDQNSEWYKLNLSDINHDWYKIDKINLSNNDYGFTLIDSKLYIFAGFKDKGFHNAFWIFELSAFSPILYGSYDENLSPSARMLHSMHPIGEKLYLFGGLGEDGELFNDFWAYDTINEKWKSIEAAGSAPSPRYGFASAENSGVIAVWGGHGSSGYLNDIYMFHIGTLQWYFIQNPTSPPSPREGACLAAIESLIIIYGGMTASGPSDELWLLNISEKTYILLDSSNPQGPGPLYYASCKIVDNSFYVYYGEYDGEYSSNEIFSYNLTSKIWEKIYHNSNDLQWIRSKAGSLKLDDRILVFGGNIFGRYLSKDIFYVNLTTSEFVKIGQIPDYTFGFAWCYLKDHIYIHGGATVLGELLRYEVPSNKFFRIHLQSDCADIESCYWECSPGTYKHNNECLLCPPGTYSDSYGNSACTNCLEGFFNQIYGSASRVLCYPCEEGTYNSIEGAALCLNCPHSAECKAGSVTFEREVFSFSDLSIQPPLYKADQDKLDRIILIVNLVFGLFGFLLIIFILMFFASILSRIDIYTSSHNHLLNVSMILTKTKIGGFFSIIFGVLAIILVSDSIITFKLDNITEQKSLVPLVVLSQDISKYTGDFVISTTFINYGGNCLVNHACSPEIHISFSNIYGSWSEMSCQLNKRDCNVIIKCKNCQIESEGEISYEMAYTNAFSSGFIIQVNSTSSIPDEISSYRTVILPNPGYVFLGFTATTVHFASIPSWFQESHKDRSYTGYHISVEQSPEYGSQFHTYEMGLAYNLYLNLQFNNGLNGLVTTRKQGQTWLTLLSVLLGSIFGLLGGVGGVMSFIEGCWTEIEDGFREDNPSALIEKGHKIRNQFDSHAKLARSMDSMSKINPFLKFNFF
ncbi:lztr1_1 [Blepharisma stoltei]|uniref:Tyrosine-protein kinase ephrin type A/B receptor-like domain-containing protein n=1 Tax=Blepharisma stoltei TaxID=1481888 RepID=A0AAU9KGA2_9CILI|nr:unnamed protein product [Blepharisma stoltei]